MKLQSAMEYLMTYGWAILIIAVAMGVLFSLGFFTPGNASSQICQLESGFSCSSFFLYQNGILSLSILQTTSTPLNITAIGCNTNSTSIATTSVNPPVGLNLAIGTNRTFSVQCYIGGTPYSGQINQLYVGYLQVNYTDITTGFPQVVFGNIAAKVSR